jgi:hypothetical protein
VVDSLPATTLGAGTVTISATLRGQTLTAQLAILGGGVARAEVARAEEEANDLGTKTGEMQVARRACTDPSNRRQNNVFDYVNDPRNPVGLLTATFVSYTAAAFNTSAGQQALADMAAKNGRDPDGTPILTSKSDIVGLQRDGFVAVPLSSADRQLLPGSGPSGFHQVHGSGPGPQN